MKKIKLFEEFTNSLNEKKFTVGDTWEWHGKDWDPAKKANVDVVKKVKITHVEGSKITGQFDGESKEYIIRDADKYLKKQVKESVEINEAVEITISLKHAKDAMGLFNDMYRDYGTMKASDVFSFKNKDAAHDFVQGLVKHLHIPVGEIDAPKDLLK